MLLVFYCGFTCHLIYYKTSLFTLKLDHVGNIEMDERLKIYIGGEMSYIDNCDLDKISLLELDDTLKSMLKYGYGERYYAK